MDTALDRMEHEHGPELAPRTMRCSAVLSHALRGAYSGGAAVDELVNAIRTTMRHDPAAVQTLSEYAYTHHLHPDYLSRRFHEIAGQTFTAERRLFRIRAAEQLLRSASRTARAVAKRAGYNDPSRFIAEFRRVVGETPGMYRKAALQATPD